MPKHVVETVTPASLTVADATGTTDPVNVRTMSRAGFENRTDSTMSLNTGTRVFSVGPTGSQFQYWSNSTRFTATGALSVSLPAASGAEHFVFFNASGALTYSSTPWDLNSDQTCSVALVYWGASGMSATYADERHSAYQNRAMHVYLHSTRGTAYDNGLACTFGSASFTCSSGRIWDEDIGWDITASVSSSRFLYRSGSASGSMLIFDGQVTPYTASAGTPYVDISGALTAVTNGNFFNSWVYATTEYNYPITVVCGQSQHPSLASAAAMGAPTVPSRTTREWKLLYQAIYQFQGGAITFQSATDYRGASAVPGAGGIASLPASAVTYVPSNGLTSTTAQGAVDQLAAAAYNRIFGGLHADYGPASLGGTGDPALVLASGTWTIISGTGMVSESLSGTNGLVSASLADGRLYFGAAGTYYVAAHASFENATNSLNHLAIFVTGTEVPRLQAAADMTANDSNDLAISGMVAIASGSYIDVRIRPTAGTAGILHHFSVETWRVAPGGV